MPHPMLNEHNWNIFMFLFAMFLDSVFTECDRNVFRSSSSSSNMPPTFETGMDL